MRVVKNIFIVYFTILLVYTGFAYPGEESERDPMIKELQSRLGQMRDFTAKIIQEKRIAFFNSTIVSSGLMKWKKPDKFFIAMNAPDASQLFLSGKVLWLYYPDEKIAEKYVLKDDQELTATFSFFALLRQFRGGDHKPMITTQADSVVLELKPSSHLFKKVKLFFSKRDLLIEKVEVLEPDGDSTVITYSNTIINSGLPDETFRFIPPAGVTVSSLGEFYPPWQ